MENYPIFIEFLNSICTDNDVFLEVFDYNMRRYIWRGTREELFSTTKRDIELKEYLHRYFVKDIYPLVVTDRNGAHPVLEVNINLR